MRKCTKCLKEKDIDEFKNIKVKGKRRRATQCAVCVAAIKRKHYEDNRDRYRQASRRYRERHRDRINEEQRRYRKENKEKVYRQRKEYNSRPEVREKRRQRDREVKDIPELSRKRKARNAVNHAIRDKRLIKPDNCERCGSGGHIEGHHKDYDLLLDVEWLCRSCHIDEHHSNEGNVS